MISLVYAPRFLRQLKKLGRVLKQEAKDGIILFQNRDNHSQLKVHKLHGHLADRLAFSINYRYRIVFRYISDNEAELLAIDDHDVYK